MRQMLSLGLALVLLFTMPLVSRAAEAGRLLQDSGVKGGLVVAIGCDDQALLASLQANDSYLVTALDVDAGKVAITRESLQTGNLYGKVSVDTFNGTHPPYENNVVNMIVVTAKDCRI